MGTLQHYNNNLVNTRERPALQQVHLGHLQPLQCCRHDQHEGHVLQYGPGQVEQEAATGPKR